MFSYPFPCSVPFSPKSLLPHDLLPIYSRDLLPILYSGESCMWLLCSYLISNYTEFIHCRLVILFSMFNTYIWGSTFYFSLYVSEIPQSASVLLVSSFACIFQLVIVFTAEKSFIVYMYHIFFMNTLTEGHQVCLHFLAITYCCAIN